MRAVLSYFMWASIDDEQALIHKYTDSAYTFILKPCIEIRISVYKTS